MTAQDATPPKSTSGAVASFKTAVGDAYQGFFDITHNSLALLGTLAAVALITLSARADLRASAEEQLLGWLLERQEAASVDAVYAAEPSAVDRVTAAQPGDLPKQQANVTYWLSRKYRVAPEPLSALVAEAFEVGEKAKLDPTLILAVMAIESRFNPFAQSPVGAQGLMQVLTRVHTDKYNDFGGQLAAFDPVSNLRVGARVLQDAVKRAGSVEGGLRLYVGAVTTDGNWYIDKVMAEHMRIQSVALGKPMQRYVPQARPTTVVAPAAPAPVAAPAAEIEAEGPAAPNALPPGAPLTRS
ncbi:MAG: lytic transglycosylase domain-containing protein [Hydrogenophaga sp.]|uniref:lytic transglycosylase domain-containing protein n=1 Tax=Hydrogenophaga sp. TaxID=1904254 RepID=UPI0025B975BE|nr:lytic transglycosylase domain-containing protein [Hydrogenophaga sp.]MBU7572284.1 lytic transglycosylase domain-containing protein [Hydrogenophaga sp.]